MNPEYGGRFSVEPRSSDGSLLFYNTLFPNGNSRFRIGIVFNGHLFLLEIVVGESEIRKWIIERLVRAIVSLPDQVFFNTGISTYIWIVTNKETRKGKYN